MRYSTLCSIAKSIAAMTLLAAETEHVRIGCHVFCMNYRNPALLAKSLMTIDHASHGRVEAGLGAGWHVQEHEGYGYTFHGVKERLDRLEEGLQIIQGMFTQERTTFEGRYYQAREATLFPRPVQSPIPIVVGGRGEKRTLKIAAQYANGWNVPYINVEEYERLNGVLDDWCEKVDRDPSELERSVNLHMLMGANDAEAARIRERARSFRREFKRHSDEPKWTLIKEMVAQEESANPLKDQEIVARLKQKNILIARRTVAKYRAELHIPSASQRKRIPI